MTRTLIIILASLVLGGCVANPYNYTYRECERINSNFSDIAKCVEHARINRPHASSDPDRGYFENFVQDLARKVDAKQMSDYSAREYVRAKIFELDKQRYENGLVRKKIEDEERARRDVEDRRRTEIQNAERIRMQQEYQRIKLANMTEEEKTEYNIKCRPYKKKYYHKMKEQIINNSIICV